MVEINKKIKKVALGKKEKHIGEVIMSANVKLPDDAPARMKVLHAEGKKWYLTVVYHRDTEQPFALFCHTNHREKTALTSNAIELLLTLADKKGIDLKFIEETKEKTTYDANTTKVTRVISLLLRHGVSIKSVVRELDKMEDIFVGSFLFQIKKFLSNYIKEGEEVEGEGCSECGGVLVYSEGCFKCRDCGYSKCG